MSCFTEQNGVWRGLLGTRERAHSKRLQCHFVINDIGYEALLWELPALPCAPVERSLMAEAPKPHLENDKHKINSQRRLPVIPFPPPSCFCGERSWWCWVLLGLQKTQGIDPRMFLIQTSLRCLFNCSIFATMSQWCDKCKWQLRTIEVESL